LPFLLDRRRQRFDVLLLVLGQQPDQALQFAACLGPGLRFVVEARLQVLQGEGEVEDVDVAAAGHRERPADVRADHEGAVDGTRRQRSLEDHLAAREVAAVLVDVDAGELRMCKFFVAHCSFLSLSRRAS